jgi:hypothetical protein
MALLRDRGEKNSTEIRKVWLASTSQSTAIIAFSSPVKYAFRLFHRLLYNAIDILPP